MTLAHRTLSVGFVIDRWDPARGGAERAVTALASHLESGGHAVHAFVERAPDPEADLPGRVERVRAAPFAWTRGARVRSVAAAGVAAARARGCDVVIGTRHVADVDVYWPHGGSHARSVAASSAAWSWRPDVDRDPAVSALGGRHRDYVELERRLLCGPGAERLRVVCVSDLVARELREDFPASPARFVVVRNGVDLERYHPRERDRRGAQLRARLSIASDSVLLAFTARDSVLKGLPVLHAALTRLRGGPWVLVVTGAEDVDAVRDASRRAGIDPRRVRFLPYHDTSAVFAAADVVVHPTWRDTSGLVVLESLACGTPVVTTSAAGEASTIDAGSGTVLARPGDAGGLARALDHWIERVRADGVDAEHVRSRVADRDAESWMRRLEEEVAGAAR